MSINITTINSKPTETCSFYTNMTCGISSLINKVKNCAILVFQKLKDFLSKVVSYFTYSKTTQVSQPTTFSFPNLLTCFNKYLPNVEIVGDPKSDITKETSQLFDHFGVKHTIIEQFNKADVPIEVWSRLTGEIAPKEKSVILGKLAKNHPLTAEEQQTVSKLKGAAACFLAHRKALLTTITKYDEVTASLDKLKQLTPTQEIKNQIKELEAQKEKLSTVCVFEHNGRFGFVTDDGSIEVSERLAKECERVLKALPENWGYLTLGTSELDPALDHRSDKIPGTLNVTKDDPLVHPGVGMACKGYACSHRIYENLKKLFSDVTDKGVLRDFGPIDAEMFTLSAQANQQNKCIFQLAATHSVIYRAASPSCHVSNGPTSYASRNYRFHDYCPEKPITCCWGHKVYPRNQQIK